MCGLSFTICSHLCIFSTPSAVNQHMLQKKNTHRATACYNTHHLWRENAIHTKHSHTWRLCLKWYILGFIKNQYQAALTQSSKALGHCEFGL